MLSRWLASFVDWLWSPRQGRPAIEPVRVPLARMERALRTTMPRPTPTGRPGDAAFWADRVQRLLQESLDLTATRPLDRGLDEAIRIIDLDIRYAEGMRRTRGGGSSGV